VAAQLPVFLPWIRPPVHGRFYHQEAFAIGADVHEVVVPFGRLEEEYIPLKKGFRVSPFERRSVSTSTAMVASLLR